MNKKQAIRKADRLFSAHIRERGGCEARLAGGPTQCNGSLQCCHIRSRRYMAIRWADDNALCLCAAHHLYFTHHPLEWEKFIIHVARGQKHYDELRVRGLEGEPMDPFDVIERLKAYESVRGVPQG